MEVGALPDFSVRYERAKTLAFPCEMDKKKSYNGMTMNTNTKIINVYYFGYFESYSIKLEEAGHSL